MLITMYYFKQKINSFPSSTNLHDLEAKQTSVIQLHTPTHAHTYYLRSLKFVLKYLKLSYMFRSHDHPQGAYIVPC